MDRIASPLKGQPARPLMLPDLVALMEMRLTLETQIAALAAQRRDRHDLVRLGRALAAFARDIDADGDALQAEREFLGALARATHNGRFVALLESLGSALLPRGQQPAPAADDLEAQARRRIDLRRVLQEHTAVLDAVTRQDADAARTAMQTHLLRGRQRWGAAAVRNTLSVHLLA